MEGRIPSASIRSFASDHGLTAADDFAWFRSIIREMDAEYLGMRAPAGERPVNQVSMNDSQGILALVRRLGKKPAAKTEDGSGPPPPSQRHSS